MNFRRIGMILMIAACCVTLLERDVKAQSETPINYSLLSFTYYPESRLGYQSLPVRVVGAGAGKLGANEPFRIMASTLKNVTEKKVTAVRLSWFIFRAGNLAEVLDKGNTDLIAVDLDALQTRKVQIPVLNVDEIPFFKNHRDERYRIEVAVTEVRYDDGSMWQGTELPQKIDPAKLP